MWWFKRRATAWEASVRDQAEQWRHRTDQELCCRLPSSDAADETTEEQATVWLARATEAARRAFGFTLHDVQLRGAWAVAQGGVVQMQTGEGKTIVAAVAAVLRARFQQGVHVATTNSYLAERDAEEMSPLFRLLGLSVGVLSAEATLAETCRAYQSDVTYGPGYQFGFDYLRDQLALRAAHEAPLGTQLRGQMTGRPIGPTSLRQRSRDFCIIDEIDSVLLDEASTPLVISGAASESEDLRGYEIARDSISLLEDGRDFAFEGRSGRLQLTTEAVTRTQRQLDGVRQLRLSRPWVTYLRNALQAQYRFQRNEHYAVIGDEVQIVDQNTGRIFADRSWRDGLHQAVQAKERVPITASETSLSRITRQRYIQSYRQVGGLTGTAMGAEAEFQSVYGLAIETLPTARPCLRVVEPMRAFATGEAKREAIAGDTEQRHQNGQPVLIGTRTIEESRRMAALLEARGLPHIVLNGLQDADESAIVANAGQCGAITIATNMAGRGTDIKLNSQSRAAGGLHAVVSEPHLSHRIDRQLIGRSSRQGDPGSAQIFVSADDLLITEHAPQWGDRLRRLAGADGECRTDLSSEIRRIQQTVEEAHARQRATLLKQDEWLDQVRQILSGAEAKC